MFDMTGTAQNFLADMLEACSGRFKAGEPPVFGVDVGGLKCEFRVIDSRIANHVDTTELRLSETPLKRKIKNDNEFSPIPASAVTVLEFEDHGQDFLRWYLDENRVVVACRPFQEAFWQGTQMTELNIGKAAVVKLIRNGKAMSLRYPVKTMMGVKPC